MDIIKTGIGISKTIKNVSRFREILTVLGRHGFSPLIIKSGLDKLIPHFVLPQKKTLNSLSQENLTTEEWWGILGKELRHSFEELGPSFIKLGQLLATREDILDPCLIAELKKLQNQVKGISFSTAKKVIQTSTQRKIEEMFSSIDHKAIGTASIGVVYQAQLKTGEKVVIKVRRPDIEKLIKTDFEILHFIIKKMEDVSTEIKFLGLSKMISDFFKSTQNELNFMIEAQNCERLKKNLEQIDKDHFLIVPKVYKNLSSKEVLVLEYLDGTPFNQFKSLEEVGPIVAQRLEKSVELFTHTLLADGFFHADLHGGNFLVLKDDKLGIIDFGLMGTLSKRNRSNLIAILYAVISYNFDNLVYEFLDVAEYENIPDHEELIRDIKDAISPHIGLSVQETNIQELVTELIKTLSKHQLYLPREWFIIFRALMTLDGVGKSIGMDINIFKVLEKDIPRLTSDLISKKNTQEELIWLSKDLISSMRIVPKHLKWFLREASSQNYSIELRVKNLENHARGLTRALFSLGMSLMASIFILCGSLFIKDIQTVSWHDIPVLTWIFWGIAGYLMMRITMMRKL